MDGGGETERVARMAASIARGAKSRLRLLVVGSRAFGPLRRLVLGTVGGAVLRDAACPVLAIPRCVPDEIDASIAAIARAAAR